MELVQDYVSRCDTIRMQLATISWTKGLSNYFVHHVPWQYTSGPYMAAKTIELLDALNQKGPLTILEIGAGSGLLAKHILDKLKQSNPEQYETISYVLTDSSLSQLNTITNQAIFEQHRSKLTIKEFSIASDILSLNIQPSVIICNNLIDSTPGYHISVTNQMCHEVKIQTHAPNSLIKYINNDWHSIITNDAHYNQAQALISQINETHKHYPNPFDELTNYANEQALDERYFNYHPLITKALIKWQQQWPESHIILNDFGMSSSPQHPSSIASLMVTYGVMSCTSVNFDLIAYMCKKNNIGSINTTNEAGSMQTMVIGPMTKSMGTCINKCLSTISEPNYLKSYISTQTMITNQPSSTQIKDIIHSNDIEYATLFLLFKEAFEKHDQDLLEIIMSKVSENYGTMAIPFECLMAQHYIEQSQPKKAIKLLQNALKSCPYINQAKQLLSTINNA